MNKRFSSGSTKGAPPATTIGEIIRSYDGEIKTGPFGTKLKAAEYSRSGVPVISVGEIQHGRIVVHENTPRVGTDVTSRMPEFLLCAGDIVFARKGSVERSSVVRKDQEGWFLGSDGIRLRLPDSCNSRFFGYQIISPQTQAWLTQQATGSTMASLNQGTIERIPCLMPDRQEQDRIADILGSLDDKIELNGRMNDTLEAMARALFKSWFIDFDPVHAKAAVRRQHPNWSNAQVSLAALPNLAPDIAELFPDRFENSTLGPIPAGWKATRVDEVAVINDWTLGKHDPLNLIDYIEISEVMRGDIGTIPRYQRGEEPSRARRRLRHGDVALSTVRPDRGAYFLCLNPPETLIASTGFAVVTAKAAPWSWVACALTCREVSEYLGHHADGGAYPAVNPSLIAAIQYAVPSDAAILERFAAICSPWLLRAHDNRAEAKHLAATRDSLLPRLLSNELGTD
jgi:type I restriction enzyme, S subunit